VHRDRFGALSPREREVLRWAASGKTMWETSVLLGLSEQTVQTYMRDAIRRLGCINKTHAVAEAVRQALI
jgi:DNA-binding CsgD family transcriptional regulator